MTSLGSYSWKANGRMFNMDQSPASSVILICRSWCCQPKYSLSCATSEWRTRLRLALTITVLRKKIHCHRPQSGLMVQPSTENTTSTSRMCFLVPKVKPSKRKKEQSGLWYPYWGALRGCSKKLRKRHFLVFENSSLLLYFMLLGVFIVHWPFHWYAWQRFANVYVWFLVADKIWTWVDWTPFNPMRCAVTILP